LDVLTALLIDT